MKNEPEDGVRETKGSQMVKAILEAIVRVLGSL